MSNAGVPVADVDEGTTCPECGEPVPLAMTLSIVAVDDDGPRIADLRYVCRSCLFQWTEKAVAK